MKHHLADSVGGDAYPASQPQAVNDAKPVVQPLAPRPDYTRVEPSNEPETYNWVVVGKDQVMIHPVADHQLMLEMSNHSHFSRPHAKGILHLFDNWDAEFELLSSNVSLTVVTKALKKAAKKYGWNFKALIDESGMPYLEKTGMSFTPRWRDLIVNPQVKRKEELPSNWQAALDEYAPGDDGPFAVGYVPADVFRERLRDTDALHDLGYGGDPDEFVQQHTPSYKVDAVDPWPVLVHDDLPIEDGYHRAAAYLRGGMTQIPVIDWTSEFAAKISMSLNPEAFAKYPKRATTDELMDMFGGDYIYGLGGASWVEPDVIPEHALLTLTVVSLNEIMPELADDPEYQMSGEQWSKDPVVTDHDYQELESAIEGQRDVAPLVLIRRPDGTYESDDGWHRASIARHLGMTEFPAYVYEPTQRTAADFGVGPNNPGVKDYMNKEWAGTDQFDQMPPPGWDDAPDESELQSGPYSCQDCDQTFVDYGQWREHVISEHTNVHRPEDRLHEPFNNMDATFPNQLMEWSRKQDQAGVVAAANDDDMKELDDFIKGWSFLDKKDPPVESKSYNHEAEIRGWPTEPSNMMNMAVNVPIDFMDQARELDRAPGEKDFEGDPQKWNALKSHIQDHGILFPVILDYNPDTGHAHVSEGNHRVQIAKELGHSHVPAILYRSNRKSYGGRGAQLQPYPEEKMGVAGYVPQYPDPNDVGLPHSGPVQKTATGLNGDLPEGLTFEYKELKNQNWLIARTPEADASKIKAGNMRWDNATGEILGVMVWPKYQRRGLATELLRRAQEIDPKVHHSDVLSDEGKAWSQAVGSVHEAMPYMSNVWYHVTHRNNLRSIRDHGLVPTNRGMGNDKNWDEYSIVTGGIYLHPTISVAETSYRGNDQWNPLTRSTGWSSNDLVMLRIANIDRSRLHPDPERMSSYWADAFDEFREMSPEDFAQELPNAPLAFFMKLEANGIHDVGGDATGKTLWPVYMSLSQSEREAVIRSYEMCPDAAWVYLGTIPAQAISLAEHPGEEWGGLDELREEMQDTYMDDETDEYANQYKYKPMFAKLTEWKEVG